MPFLETEQTEKILEYVTDNENQLKKLYRSKNSSSVTKSIKKDELDFHLNEGWEVNREFKNKVKVSKEKNINTKFRDDIWCQFYKLGYKTLNHKETISIPYEKKGYAAEAFDIIAVNTETVLIVSCYTSEELREINPNEANLRDLKFKLEGLKKSLWQVFGKEKKIKYIFATKNLRLPPNSEELRFLENNNSFYYNNNTYKYINQLIEKYKNVAFYQFLGLVFKSETINQHKIEIPAIKGSMGKKTYYMFSIEPNLLLKMGFILHRTRANESEFPTYQRLLVPSRLKGITDFIDMGGYFPNSIIVNFNTKNKKINFEAHSNKSSDSSSCSGKLILPNAYGVAYIIDGQHRLYGYANSKYLETNTIPVVAFEDLDTIEQLEMFMDINENQKAVSPSLKLDLEEDLLWNSERADSRLKALRSSIIKELANLEYSPLQNKISVGEDKELLTFKPFYNGIAKSGLLPTAKNNNYDENSLIGAIYDIKNTNTAKEMQKAKKNITELLIACYSFVEKSYPNIFRREKYFIVSNRGTHAFICLIGDLNKFETQNGNLDYSSSPTKRFEIIKKYLIALLDGITELSQEEERQQLNLLGQGADVKWLRFFQTHIHKKYLSYEPLELIDWQERQDEELQDKGRRYGVEIEKYMKETILVNLELLFGNNWEFEIGDVRQKCRQRADEEQQKNYNDGLGQTQVDWKTMFNIVDYKKIIEKFFTKKPDGDHNFTTFEKIFSIDIGEGFNSKNDKLKWINKFNSYRNRWAHEGTKEKRLNKTEVEFLENIHHKLYSLN